MIKRAIVELAIAVSVFLAANGVYGIDNLIGKDAVTHGDYRDGWRRVSANLRLNVDEVIQVSIDDPFTSPSESP